MFQGKYEKGKKQGQGKYVWKDGSYYEGDFKADNIEGEGVYFSKNCTFRGQFRENVKHGVSLNF